MASSLLLGSKSRHDYDLANQDDEENAPTKPSQSSQNRGRMGLFVRLLGLVFVLTSWTYLVGSNSYHAGVRRIATEYQKLNIDGEFPFFPSQPQFLGLESKTALLILFVCLSKTVDMVHRTFRYDSAFPQPPTSNHIHSDYPWANLYPEHGPYFNKSASNPERWTFSVFHQLHCVVSEKLQLQAGAKGSFRICGCIGLT